MDLYNLSLTCGLECAQEKCLKHKCYFEVYSRLSDSQLNIIMEILHKEMFGLDNSHDNPSPKKRTFSLDWNFFEQ